MSPWMNRHRVAIAAVLLLAGAGLAMAQTAGAPGGRYQIEASGPNVLRLDRETGAIASCSSGEDEAWTCETLVAADAPAAPTASLQEENARLRARVEVLERRLGAIRSIAAGGPVPDGVGTAADGGGDGGATSGFGDTFDLEEARRDIDTAVEVTGYAVRRFRDLVEALTEEEAAR
ncbi:hypothetical protein [Acuticoccus sp.]|uniref:hypothetical protein n=1 Tax=Acuticoccus sp. TaxID=1904378 RepID=UPI003B51F07C